MNNTIVLIGIGGAGMSSLAGLLLELGYSNIVGVSNITNSKITTLKTQGIYTHIGHGNYQVTPSDFVIYSQAAKNVIEVKQAFENNENNHVKSPPPMSYPQFLGELSKYMKTIAITGTHGKSTTTGLTANTLQKIAPNFGIGIVGATISDWGGTSYTINHNHKQDLRKITDHILFRKGPFIENIMKQLRFVIEACEYNKHFLHYDPDYAIITNCELDHISSYANKEEYYETFCQFIKRVKNHVYIPKNEDIGLKYCLDTLDQTHLQKIHKVSTKPFFFTSLLGGHNNINASLGMALLQELYPNQKSTIKKSLSTFQGLSRRAENIGKNNNGVIILSDYGHHPTELFSTLQALKERYPNEPIISIFQPHQITRVVEFWDEFKEALTLADMRYLTPIFDAREDFQEIKAIHNEHQITKSSSLSEFNLVTGDYRNATLIENENIIKTIHSIKKGIIIYFTAGDLDEFIKKEIL